MASDGFTLVGVWSSEDDAGRDVAEVIAEIIEAAAIVNDGIRVTMPSATYVVWDWSVGGSSGRSVSPTGPHIGRSIAQTMRGMNVFRYYSAGGARGPAELEDGGRIQQRDQRGRYMRGFESGTWALVVYVAEDPDDVPSGEDAPF